MSTLQTTKSKVSPRQNAYSVAFQGEIGAYSQSAVYAFFGRDNVKQVIPLPTFRRVFASLFSNQQGEDTRANQTVDFAVVPIENSLAGSVGETIDLLLSNDVQIVGEVSIPILHTLISHKDSSIDQITKVISHPQAIAQCKLFLDARNWQQIAVYDTAGAAKMIRDENLKDTAAIASELAAEIYGLKILERSIEDDHSNQTRFVVIEAKSKIEKGDYGPNGFEDEEDGTERGVRSGYKTSLIFSTRHKPGSLVEALSVFSARGLNLTKIESRPMKSRPWEYYFFVDFEGHLKDENCAAALAELKDRTREIKILGSYKRSL